MRKYVSPIFGLGLLMLCGLLLSNVTKEPPEPSSNDPVQEAAFRILEAKCNSCHRKRNPFMVFRAKKMDRRADRIYQAVFVQKRMPKAGGDPLTKAEADTLRQWLETKINQP